MRSLRVWMRMFLVILFAFLILGLVFIGLRTPLVWASEVTLAWDANKAPDLAGYRIFCREAGTEYNYKSPAWEGVETTCTIFDLPNDVVYYFVARAFDKSGNESSDSNEVDNGPPDAPCLSIIFR